MHCLYFSIWKHNSASNEDVFCSGGYSPLGLLSKEIVYQDKKVLLDRDWESGDLGSIPGTVTV